MNKVKEFFKGMNKKQLVIFIVGVLLLTITVSYAYFTASSKWGGIGSSTKGEVTSYAGTDLITTGVLEFKDTGILPGHQNISSIEVNAKNDADGINVIYNLIWKGTNTLKTPLTYKVYKTDTKINASVDCEKVTEASDGVLKYFEECTQSNISELGGVVGSGTIPANTTEETKLNLVINEEATATKEGTKAYYYVVLEYPNLSVSQNEDIGGSFEGIVTTEILGEKEMPIVQVTSIEYTEAQNGWYSSVTISANATNSNDTVSSIISCTTTDDECTPSETKCSGAYKVDSGAPTNNSIVINSNAASTTSTSVTLTLASTGATEMCISSSSSCTSWEEYATSKSYTLDSTLGNKTIYAYFRDDAGNVSSVVSDTIQLRAVIANVPSQSNTLTYTGSSQSPTWSNYSTSNITIGGTTSGTNAGSYNATFTPKTNYEWSDGTTTAKTVSWTINKASGSISVSPTSLTVTEGKTGDITVTRSGDGAITASSSSTSIAVVSVSGTTVTVTGKSAGSATITINVAAGTNYKAPTSKTVSVTVEKKTAKDTILANAPSTTSMPSITGISTDTSNTLYTVADDDGTSYVYRGNPSNNWVQFGGYYWRIIRINGDGSIRMIYNGTSTTTTGTGTQIGTSLYNSSMDDNAYVGFMYGTTGASTYEATHANTNNSTIKGQLDSWYTSSGLSNYAEYINANAGFCNDRETMSGVDDTYFGTLGYGKNATSYAPYGRLYYNNAWKTIQTPSLKCTNASNDLYTMTNSNKGNKKLTNPVGLITSDEVVYAGGFGGTNNTNYYVYTGQYYWTMSPSYVNVNGTAVVFGVNSNGRPFDFPAAYVGNATGIRPVINLRSDVTLTGSGTSTDSYKVS